MRECRIRDGGVILMVVVAGCTSIPQRARPMSTPLETWQSYWSASEARDYQAMLACIAVKERDRYSKYYALMRDYSRDLEKTAKAIDSKFAEAEGARFRAAFIAPLLTNAESSSKDAEVVIADGCATIRLSSGSGRPLAELQRGSDGRWYLTEFTGGAPQSGNMTGLEGLLRVYRESNRGLRRKIERGEVTRDEIMRMTQPNTPE